MNKIMCHFLRMTLLGPSFEWLDFPLQMDLHLSYRSVKDWVKRGFFFSIIFSPRDLDTYSFVQSQSVSAFSLPMWLLSDEAFHPSGSLKYHLCSMYSCSWLWTKLWDWSSQNLLVGSIGKECSDSGSAHEGSFKSFLHLYRFLVLMKARHPRELAVV